MMGDRTVRREPLLRAFVVAIAAFRDDAEHIYNESIEPKRASLEANLARERPERSWQPNAAHDGGALQWRLISSSLRHWPRCGAFRDPARTTCCRHQPSSR